MAPTLPSGFVSDGGDHPVTVSVGAPEESVPTLGPPATSTYRLDRAVPPGTDATSPVRWDRRIGKDRGVRRLLAIAVFGMVAVRALYRRLVAGDVVIDLGMGRSVRPLGPFTMVVDAPPTIVWEVVAAPYLGRSPVGLRDKIEVIERSDSMVLAAHRTDLGGGRVATTIETVRFEEHTSVHFRLMRGPVPHVVETFSFYDVGDSTRFDYEGELGTDLWALGRWWGAQVARHWEDTVHTSMADIKQRAEARASRHRARSS
jgi:Polyketide cyclase / dehydrase and lipid transport